MKKSVLITGASSGFGLLMSKTLAEADYEVYATMRDIGGRNSEAAKALGDWAAGADRSLEVVELDVTSDDSVATAAKTVLEKTGGLDVIVNNAGVLSMGFNEAFSNDDFQWVFDVNVHGPIRVTNAFLPKMREKGDGLLIAISSLMGRIVLPFAGPYTASKWALEGLFESWRYELNPLGIDTVIIEPGGFPTEITGKIGQPSNGEVMGQYGPTMEAFTRWTGAFEEMFSGDNVPNPQDVADAVKKSIETPKGERPFRVTVDTLMTGPTEAINIHNAGAQKQILDSLGMGALAELKK